ncbi:MAG: L,D-transpeptidase family protein [Burkholderiales bacterium]|nr:L,D-transpeptidase family protein [Burkholderiales bacterium]
MRFACKTIFFFVISLLLLTMVSADEINPNEISYEAPTLTTVIYKKVNENKFYCTENTACLENAALKQLYMERGGVPIWFNNAGNMTEEVSRVIKIFKNSYKQGLNPNDFHIHELISLSNQFINADDLSNLQLQQKLDFEFLMSDAYITYSKEIQMGRINPKKIYPDWGVSRSYVDVILQFKKAIENGDKLAENLNTIEPTNFQYVKLKEQLQHYLSIAINGGWQNIDKGHTLKIGSQGNRVAHLRSRLALTGELVNNTGDLKYDEGLKEAVLLFQKEFNLKQTGTVESTTLAALNIPVETRLKQIAINLDRSRWLPKKLSNNFVWVNIPSYSLQIYSGNNVELAMPVIVGQDGENKTCVVTSSINALGINPYWGIPRRIATREYLAKVQKDPEYLIKHKIRVYQGNVEVDQSTINWSQYTVRTFPYYLRQDSGVGNALGHLKFIFSNTCGIYLHDTARRDLFNKVSRSMSHGCIRVGKPTELASYLLESNATWTPEKLSDSIKSGKHKWLSLNKPIDLYIVYLTAATDSNGVFHFYKDIYGADQINFKVYIPKAEVKEN